MPADTAALEQRLEALGRLLNGWMREALAGSVQPPAERFGEMLEYHLGWRDAGLAPLPVAAPPGKRLRPAATLLVCEAVCGSVDPAAAAAVAVELVHNFSLVHDDIQDRGETRRFRASVWVVWGEAQAINVGDALFALAQAHLAERGGPSAAAQVAALNRACLRLVEGQYLDLAQQAGQERIGLEGYEAMVARKTAALFAAACRLGALAGGADDHTADRYEAFGREVGIAFQEQDDVLGVWGSPDETGKPPAADVRDRKRALPAVLALAQPDAPDWLRALYAADTSRPLGDDEVRRVIAHLDVRGVRAEVEGRIQARYRAALAALDAAGGRDPAHAHLRAMTDLLLRRRS